jgi:hypothetical protein
VHVIRNAMRFVSYKDRKPLARSMREIYTAPTLEAAELSPFHGLVFSGDLGQARRGQRSVIGWHHEASHKVTMKGAQRRFEPHVSCSQRPTTDANCTPTVL